MPSRPSSPRLRPCIAELLRTCVHPPTLILRVDKVLVEYCKRDRHLGTPSAQSSATSNEEEHGAYRLWLSDGELLIQAVLAAHLHQIFGSEDIDVGSLLDLKKFKVQRGRRKHGTGEVVYLAIADYEIVSSAKPATADEAVDLNNEGGFIREQEQPSTKKRRLNSDVTEQMARVFPPPSALSYPTSSQESDEFETTSIDHTALSRRRQVLHELSSNSPTRSVNVQADHSHSPRKRRRLLDAIPNNPSSESPPSRPKPTSPTTTTLTAAPVPTASINPPAQASSLPSQPPPMHTTTNTIPPLHTLSSLLHPAPTTPSRNYTCSIFAVITWISPNLIYPRPHSPFPAKRHVKIHDPSIASRYASITLAVYDRAADFRPTVGTIALFRGVVMQRWEGEVILNAYARRRKLKEGEEGGEERRSVAAEEEWFVSDETKLVGMGFDVPGMRTWWEERKRGARK